MSGRLETVSTVLAAMLTICGITLLGMAVGFGLAPGVMAGSIQECSGPFVSDGCRQAANHFNQFALYSLAGGLIVAGCGAVGLASVTKNNE